MQAMTIKATDILRSEHEVILDVLSALDSVSRPAADGFGLDVRSARECLEFLRNFVDRCHHAKEEQIFFSALVARGMPVEAGPLFVMKSEHGDGRALIARMADALPRAERSQPGAGIDFGTAGVAYVELMRDHIAKENGVLFPIGDGMLSEAEQENVLRGFETFEHADMGAGAHERFLGLANELIRRFGIVRRPDSNATHGCCGHGTKCS